MKRNSTDYTVKGHRRTVTRRSSLTEKLVHPLRIPCFSFFSFLLHSLIIIGLEARVSGTKAWTSYIKRDLVIICHYGNRLTVVIVNLDVGILFNTRIHSICVCIIWQNFCWNYMKNYALREIKEVCNMYI